MTYREFELVSTNPLTVKQEGQKLVTFRVQVVRSPAGEKVAGVDARYDAKRLRQLLAPIEMGSLDRPRAMELGLFLADALLPGPVRELLVRSLDITEKIKAIACACASCWMASCTTCPGEYLLLNRAGGEASPTDFLALSPSTSIVRHQPAEIPSSSRLRPACRHKCWWPSPAPRIGPTCRWIRSAASLQRRWRAMSISRSPGNSLPARIPSGPAWNKRTSSTLPDTAAFSRDGPQTRHGHGPGLVSAGG